MNGCCMRNAYGEEYPGQFAEMGGSHDPDCRYYKGPPNPKPQFAPLPPGFAEARARNQPSPRYNNRIGPNYTLTANAGIIAFRFDRKPGEETLVALRHFMKWNSRAYVWECEDTPANWERCLVIAERTVLPPRSVPTAQRRYDRIGFTASEAYGERTDDYDDDLFGYGD